jgi:hypothetical protein
MKKIKIQFIIALLACGLPFIGNAQPYKLFVPKVDYLFYGFDSYHSGIKGFKIVNAYIDSKGDSIYTSIPEAFLYYSDSTRKCIKGRTFSWISPVIIAKTDGTNILFNLNNDSIILKTKAGLNDTWTCYLFKDGARIQAILTSFDTISFLGVNDSVKVISFKYYDSANVQKPYNLDNLQVILSKNYGMIQTLNFLCFPDITVNSQVPLNWDNYSFFMFINSYQLEGFNNKLGIMNFGQQDIFDYQTGDELDVFTDYKSHYCKDQTTETKRLVLERTDLSDSIKYKIREISKVKLILDSGEKNWISDTVIYEKISRHNDYLDQLPGIEYNSSYPDLFYYNWPKINGSTKTYPGDDVIPYDKNSSSSCFGRSIVDGCPCERYYQKGLGGPYMDGCCCFTDYREEKLVYYKKGNKTWGTPFSIKPEQNIKNSPTINIYPNPWNSSAILFVNTTAKGNILIINNLGQVIYEKELPSGQNTITLSRENFEAGVYFLEFIQQNGVQTSKIFVVQ